MNHGLIIRSMTGEGEGELLYGKCNSFRVVRLYESFLYRVLVTFILIITGVGARVRSIGNAAREFNELFFLSPNVIMYSFSYNFLTEHRINDKKKKFSYEINHDDVCCRYVEIDCARNAKNIRRKLIKIRKR